MNVLFLDVDGVLNCMYTKEKTPYGYVGIDDDKVEMLSKICDKFKMNAVLSSDWRDCLMKKDDDGKYLVDKLYKKGLYLIGTIPSIRSSQRGLEIKSYLDTYTSIIEKYVILDDYVFDFREMSGIGNHLVLTDDKGMGPTKNKGILSPTYLEYRYENEPLDPIVEEVIKFIKDERALMNIKENLKGGET